MAQGKAGKAALTHTDSIETLFQLVSLKESDPNPSSSTLTPDDLNDFMYNLSTSATEALREGHSLNSPLFKVVFHSDERSIFDTFIANLPESLQQHANCFTCRRFVDRYADLALVNENGTLNPVFWSYGSTYRTFQPAVQAVRDLFHNRSVSKVLRLSHRLRYGGLLGHVSKNGYHHMHVKYKWDRFSTDYSFGKYQPPEATTEVAAARVIRDLLDKYDPPCLLKAESILKQGQLSNAGVALGAVAWLRKLQKIQASSESIGEAAVHNLIYYHVVIQTRYLERLQFGVPTIVLNGVRRGAEFSEIEAEWNAVMEPTQYKYQNLGRWIDNIQAAKLKTSRLNKSCQKLGAASMTVT